MNNMKNVTLKEFSEMVYKLIYGPAKKDLLDAYGTIYNLCDEPYCYDEVKDYLFHHDLEYVL